MAGFSSKYIKVAEFKELKKVEGKNGEFNIAEFILMEPITKKKDNGDYKTVGHNYFEAKVVGDDAAKAAMDLDEGVVLDLSAEIRENDDGSQWIWYPAQLEGRRWEYQGKEYFRDEIRIYSYKIRD